MSELVAFKLWGDYAHYSHPATIYSSLTYPLPPKTVMMGFLGALIGEEAHYKLSNFRYSIKLDAPLVKKRFVFNGIKFALSSNMNLKEGYQNAKEKKQFYRELICVPRYTVFLDLTELSGSYRKQIVTALREHTTKFTPYLGINFCIADFEWIAISRGQKVEDEVCQIDTFTLLEDFVFESNNFDVRLTTARMACGVEEGRIFKEYRNFVVEIGAQKRIKSKNHGNIYQINDDVVYFV